MIFRINLDIKYKMSNNNQKIIESLNSKGLKFISKDEDSKVKYECRCRKILIKRFSDIMRRNCRYCKNNKLNEFPDEKYKPQDTENEIWKPVLGAYISSLGNCVNSLGQLLTKDSSNRYHVNFKHQYISRLIAEAFKIKDYENLNKSDYIVIHIDNDINNNKLDNLLITTKSNKKEILNYKIKNDIVENKSEAENVIIQDKKRKAVVQKDKNTGEIINKFPSIAEASRKTKEAEHIISSILNNKKCSNNQFLWKKLN